MFEIGTSCEENQALGTTLQWPGYVKSVNLKCIPPVGFSAALSGASTLEFSALQMTIEKPQLLIASTRPLIEDVRLGYTQPTMRESRFASAAVKAPIALLCWLSFVKPWEAITR